ncbi:MAG: hypothetical protein IKC81_04630 [Paludibacteraceae bacterium]|nr:hypothetical protein [Paludibacteraceae bacterium]
MNNKIILENLLERVKASKVLVLRYLEKAGVPLRNEGEISLRDIQNLYITNVDVWEECMQKLYPDAEEYFAVNGYANAGGFDWMTLVGGILGGAGTSLLSMGSANSSQDALANQELLHKQELAEQEAASSKKMLWIVLAIMAVVVVAGIFIFKKRF